MRVLLDTHTLIWSAIDAPELSSRVREILTDPNAEAICSLASFWEISIKVSLAKLELATSLNSFFADIRDRVELLAIEERHCLQCATLPFHHRDPFDRMLISQAKCENLPVLGNDESFDAYNVRRIW